ncbi:peptide ABC transporter permease [Gardnerella sp. KA00255]|uniref:peptide ABC transporter permease n=1 Tax=Gardnerella sp. KA00255 TaxID=2749073 RepID=UPI003BA8B0E8
MTSAKKQSAYAKKQSMYMRRRIFVGVVAVLILALAIFCVVSISKGFSAISGEIFKTHNVDIARKAVPDPRPASLTRPCTSKDLRLELSAKSQNVPMGGSVDFKANLIFVGTGSCLVNAAPDHLILAISDSSGSNANSANGKNSAKKKDSKSKDSKSKDNKSKDNSAKDNSAKDNSANSGKNKSEKDAKDTKDSNSTDIWRSDVCPVIDKPLLMAQGDHFDKKFTWDTDATRGVGCVDKDNMPKVNRGPYVVRIFQKDIPGLQSDSIVVNVN